MTTETSRIEAFSDGVFAIAITLLVLEIKVPSPSLTSLRASNPAVLPASLAAQLAQQWPSYIAFLLSFLFIGVMWINHHRLFTHIRKATDGLLLLNLLLLLGVTSVPFPTAVLALHLGTPGSRTAAAVYNGTYLLIAVFFNLLWRYAVCRGLLGHDVDAHSARAITKQYAFGPALYAVCLALVWVSVILSLTLNAALAVFFAIPAHHISRGRKGPIEA